MWKDTKTGCLGCCVQAFGPFFLIFLITEERQLTALVTDVQELWGALGFMCVCVCVCVYVCGAEKGIRYL